MGFVEKEQNFKCWISGDLQRTSCLVCESVYFIDSEVTNRRSGSVVRLCYSIRIKDGCHQDLHKAGLQAIRIEGTSIPQGVDLRWALESDLIEIVSLDTEVRRLQDGIGDKVIVTDLERIDTGELRGTGLVLPNALKLISEPYKQEFVITVGGTVLHVPVETGAILHDLMKTGFDQGLLSMRDFQLHEPFSSVAPVSDSVIPSSIGAWNDPAVFPWTCVWENDSLQMHLDIDELEPERCSTDIVRRRVTSTITVAQFMLQQLEINGLKR